MTEPGWIDLRYLRRALIVLVCLLAALTAVRAALVLPRGGGLTDESGVLAGLAMDACNGVFYRPLFSALGYGGTRYGPLHIALHAALMKVFSNPILSGHLIALFSVAVLIPTLFRILRKLGVQLAVARVGAVLFIASAAGQFALTTIRVDLLATTLSIAGILLVLVGAKSPREQPLRFTWATFAFALAGLTKFTTIFGVVASFIWLMFNRRWKSAMFVAGVTLLLWLAGVGGFNVASHGRLLVNWRACANGGRPPLTVPQWGSVLKQAWVMGDHGGLFAVLAASVAWVISPKAMKFSLIGLLFVCSTGLTLLMFFSPGIGINSLLDADIAAILFLVFLTTLPMRPCLAVATLLVLTGVSLGDYARLGWVRKAMYHRLDDFRTEVAKTGYTGGPIFSDHSLVPVALGQSPFLLDDFNLAAVRKHAPGAEADLYHRLEMQYFQAIILRYDPSGGERRWTLGMGFLDRLNEHYELVDKSTGWDRLWVYRPKPK